MKQQVVYNLEEFATKYHLKDIFGAYAAHFSIGAAYSSIIEIDATAPTNTDFSAMVQERALFTKLLLVKQGQCQLQLHADTNAEIQHLSAHHLLLVTPQEIATLVDVSPDFEAECCLVDELITKQPGCYQLPDEKYQSVLDIFLFLSYKNKACRHHPQSFWMLPAGYLLPSLLGRGWGRGFIGLY